MNNKNQHFDSKIQHQPYIHFQSINTIYMLQCKKKRMKIHFAQKLRNQIKNVKSTVIRFLLKVTHLYKTNAILSRIMLNTFDVFDFTSLSSSFLSVILFWNNIKSIRLNLLPLKAFARLYRYRYTYIHYITIDLSFVYSHISFSAKCWKERER